MRRIRMLGALLLCGLTLAGVVATAAEGAGPPGANPQNRGYELVSLPDTAGASMYPGIEANDQAPLRGPALARGGGRAFVTSVLPIKDQPDAGLASSFTAVRTPTGWRRDYNGLPSRRSAFDSVGVPVAWTPDFQTLLWSTTGAVADPTDPSPARDGFGSVLGLLRQPLGGTPAEQLNAPGYGSAAAAQQPLAAVSDDGRITTFTVVGGHLRAGDPDGTIYRRVSDGPPEVVSVDAGGSPAGAGLKAVASDGSATVYEGSLSGAATGNLFHRAGSASPVEIDRDRDGGAAARTASVLVSATSAGDVVYFVTRDRLVAADTDADSDLYRWSAAGDSLDIVSRGTGGGGNGGAVDCPTQLPSTQIDYSPQGCDVAFVGADRSGDLAYFLSPERLGGAAAATPGAANVYVRRAGGAAPRYLMTLDGADRLPTGLSLPRPLVFREAAVAGDGALLVRTVADPAGGPARTEAQIVRLDPDSGAAGCLSCAPAGEPDAASALASPGDGQSQLPAENATADGRFVFFESSARLVPEDRNGKPDVYEYDTASGTRSLVSTGADPAATFFAGVNDDGADVLLLTRATLASEDRNGRTLKVYDARRDGGFPEPAPPPPACDGESCRPAALPRSAVGDPPSTVFRGAGNLRAPLSLRAAALSARSRRLLAAGGAVSLRVRASRAATVRVRGVARIGTRRREVIAGRVRLRAAGSRSVRLRLNAAGRRALAAGGRLTISLSVTASGAATPRPSTVVLRASRKGSR